MWITKYRKKLLRGDAGVRLRQIVRTICAELEVEILKLRNLCWGRHLWARGFFVASSGNVADEVIMEYIRTQEIKKEDDDFRVEA